MVHKIWPKEVVYGAKVVPAFPPVDLAGEPLKQACANKSTRQRCMPLPTSDPNLISALCRVQSCVSLSYRAHIRYLHLLIVPRLYVRHRKYSVECLDSLPLSSCLSVQDRYMGVRKTQEVNFIGSGTCYCMIAQL